MYFVFLPWDILNKHKDVLFSPKNYLRMVLFYSFHLLRMIFGRLRDHSCQDSGVIPGSAQE